MDIYVSGNAQKHEMTPMHAYKGTPDFSVILKDMERGLLPVGTGKPFPVVFQDDDDQMTNQPAVSPWSQLYAGQSSDPPAYDVFGPKHFGL